MADVLRVKNWKEYQHYKDRAPPWIKLHFNLLQSRDWVMLDDAGRVLAVACMLLASRSELPDGEFEADPEYFKRVAYLNSEPDFKPLIELGFLEVSSGCKQMLANDTECNTEGETEAYKTEKEKEQEANASSPDAENSAPETKYVIPMTGGKEHPVTQSDIDRYRELFPSVDVEQSIRAMLAWLDSNPAKRSGSARGAKTRMTSWLTRDQDKASRQPRANGSKPPIADDYSQKRYEGTPDDELPESLR